MDIFLQILLQLILILLNAFFAATEIALLSINEKKVKARAEDGDKTASKMLKIISNPTSFLSTIQIGITLAGFLGSAFAADNFADRLSDVFVTAFDIPASAAGTINTVAVILITLILSYFTLVLGELVPKRVAMKHKDKWAEFVCGFISVLAAILKPVIWLLSISTNAVLRMLGIDPNEKEEPVSEEDIELMLDAGADEGSFGEDDIQYIKNVFKLNHLTAADVMTQRRNLICIPKTITKEELYQVIRTEGYTRIPVYDSSPDEMIGTLHAKEFLLQRKDADYCLDHLIAAPVYVPETMHLDLLFKQMQTDHTHIVIVVNEYGITSGIVTMEDILEEIVGEIWDESDEAVELFEKIDENTYKFPCSSSIEAFFHLFDLEDQDETESTTINGWLTEQKGSIPKVGDRFEYGGYTLEVTDADEVMAKEVLVTVNEVEDVE